MNAVTNTDRWDAVQQRRPDRGFVYAVRTTGVFCFPDSAARRPRRANVEFFDNAAAAITAGYRPCRRCRPTADEPHAESVQRMRAALDDDPTATLTELGRIVALSPSQVQRVFRRATGLTPREYARAAKQQHADKNLRGNKSVTDAAFAAGFGSLRGFYDQTAFGMSPNAVRQHGGGLTIHFTVFATPVGCALLATSERGVCAARFGDDETALVDQLHRDFARATIERADDELHELARAFVDCLDGDGGRGALPLDIKATAFQQRVWDALRTIPRGETRTYGEIATLIGAPNAARAVGNACGANPVAVIIPCHRSIGSDGGLHGYRWGPARKQMLLDRERRA